jgi:hypothetical protein
LSVNPLVAPGLSGAAGDPSSGFPETDAQNWFDAALFLRERFFCRV